ncbi:hypothetical protein L1787_15125 [Acuticoccus sp. M5D2P5]|uniref:hypothetical protein n=1 Tax=Acuticoccus kalidii TaxID=2910977 RepID=UPI001F35F0AD|nr:hypothetical protein [Acuticoccus kalidii]MCF3934733.1 hypothetical protein [Acuticoccus kalidii]
MKLFRSFGILLLAVGITHAADAADLGAPPPEPELPASAKDWQFAIAAYIWGAGLDGTVGVGRLPRAHIDMSFGDILSDLDFASFTSAELRYRRWIGFMDLQYVKITPSATTPNSILTDRVKLRSETLSWIFAGGYRAYDGDRIQVDALAGGRLWSVSNRVSVSGGLLGSRSRELTETWVDPIIGLKARADLNPNFYVLGWGFVGGFGVASDIDWDVLGALGWSPKENFSLLVGYRAQGVDYSTSSFEFDVIQHGPVIGGIFRF